MHVYSLFSTWEGPRGGSSTKIVVWYYFRTKNNRGNPFRHPALFARILIKLRFFVEISWYDGNTTVSIGTRYNMVYVSNGVRRWDTDWMYENSSAFCLPASYFTVGRWAAAVRHTLRQNHKYCRISKNLKRKSSCLL